MAGSYLLMIDVRWGKTAMENAILRDILLCVTSPQPLTVSEMASQEALNIMKTLFYDHMKQKPASQMVNFFPGEMKYAFYHFESQPYKHSWLGYLIT